MRRFKLLRKSIHALLAAMLLIVYLQPIQPASASVLPETYPDASVWTVDPSLGSMDADGVFTADSVDVSAGALNGNGEVEVVDNLTELQFPDVVTTFDSGASVVLEDFENGIGNYIPSSAAANSVNISLESTEDFVRFGNNSLKLEYDFTGTTGTSGAYLTAKDTASRIQIPGYPEKISMWVYGDGKKHWLRGQLRDGDDKAFAIDFTSSNPGVNWTGWKYVEVDVPKGKVTPFTMDMPVRYMETSNANKTAGAIYIDQIRAIYGPIEEDRTPPILKNPYPAEDETIYTATPDIRIFGEDDGYDQNTHPGTALIDPDQIRVYLDGTLVNHGFYPPEGRIAYEPTTPLIDGVHTIRVSIRDLSGNQTIKEWNFMVNTGAPKFVYDTPSEIYAGGTYTLDIKGENVIQLQGGFIEFGFDSAVVENLQVLKGAKITDAQLQPVIDGATGNVSLTFAALDQLDLNDSDLVAQIQYTVKRDVLGPLTVDEAFNEVTHSNVIKYVSGSIMMTGGTGTPSQYNGQQVKSAIKTNLQLVWNDSVLGLGYPASFLVRYKNGNPAIGAKLLINGVEVSDAVSDEQGLLTTQEVTKSPATYTVQALVDGQYSPVMNLKVQSLAGAPVPHNINVTMGDKPTSSRNFAWHTHPDIKETVVEIVKQSEFTDFNQSNVLKFNGSSFIYNTNNAGTLRAHQATADGLEPDTAYIYRVGDGISNYSVEGTFRTSPESGDVTKFIFIGDSQAADKPGYDLWGATLQKALDFMPEPDFVVHAGDMVDKGFEEREWNWFFDTAQKNLMKTTFVPIIGNHEVMGLYGNSDYLAHFNNPRNGLEGVKGSSFSYDIKDVHFVVLNSEMKYQEQKEWLQEDLKKTDKKWKVVFFHRGPYGSIYDTPEVRDNWTPVFDEYGVDLVMNGHEHVYLRTFPMKGDKQVANGEGTIYLVGGASGPKFYPLTEKPFQEVAFAETTQIYTAVETSGNQMTVKVRTVGGIEVDHFQLTAKPQKVIIEDNPGQQYNPIPTPNPELETAPGRLEVKAEDMKSNDGKSVVVVHANPINELILPGNVTTWTGDMPITIKAPNMIITIPSEVLKAVTALAEAGELSDSTISLKAFKVEEAQAAQLLANAEKLSGSNVAGDIIDFTLAIVTKEGRTIQLNQFSEPISIALKVHPNFNKKLTGIYYISDSGKLEYIGGKWEDGMLTAKVSHFSKYGVLEYNRKYNDVSSTHWASDVILELSAKQLVQGVSAVSFDPDRSVTRAEFAAMLVRALGIHGEATQSFTDVSKEKWYSSEVALAVKAGIVNGISATEFAPEVTIKRQEMATMIVRAYEYALGHKVANSKATKFADLASAPQWAKEAIQAAFEVGLLNGRSNNRFEPLASGTRAEVAKLISNLLSVIE